MLATILKGEQAVRTTLSIIETYAEVRAMKRELLALHAEPDVQKRNSMMRHFGEALTHEQNVIWDGAEFVAVSAAGQ